MRRRQKVALDKKKFFVDGMTYRGGGSGRGWFDEDERKGLPNRADKFIKIYDAELNDDVWLEWNCSWKEPRVHRFDRDHKKMWWCSVDLETIRWCETAERIPSVQPWPGCSMSANVRLAK